MEFSNGEEYPLRHAALAQLDEFQRSPANVAGSSPQEGRSQLQELEDRRDGPDGFCEFVITQDLAAITTVGELNQRVAALRADLEQMPPEERFNTLFTWRTMANIGDELVTTARTTVRLAKALEAYKDRPLAELTDEEHADLRWEMRDPDRATEFSLSTYTDSGPTLLEQDENTPIAFLEVPETAPDHVKAAAEFACPADAVKTELIYKAVAAQSGDLIGRDAISGEPVILNFRVKSFQQAQAYSRPLPKGLNGWRRLGLLEDDSVPEYAMAFYGSSAELERVDDILVAGERGAGAARPYIAAQQALLDSRGRLVTAAGRRALEREVKRTQRNFLGHMLPEIIRVFEEAEQPLHPDIEQRARNLAGYVLSGGSGWKFPEVHSRLNETASQPLAAALPALFEVAYEKGLAPLVLQNK